MRQPAMQAKPDRTRAPAPVRTRPHLRVWLMAVGLVVVTIALYWPATRGNFVNYDDDLYVTSNVHVQNGLTWEGIKWACLNPVCWNWHPLTVVSHMADCQLFGLKPWGHHLTNVLLHALNAGLVFVLLQQMTGTAWPSLLVAALFAFHPLRVESVAWVSERKDVLSGCFGLLALMCYARYATGGQRSEVRDQRAGVRGQGALFHLPSAIFYLLSLGFLACGLMSKPTLVTWPFAMLLLDYWPLGRMQKAGCRIWDAQASDTRHHPRSPLLPLMVEKLPFLLLAAFASVATFVVQRRGGSLAAGESLSLAARSGNALVCYCRHLGSLFWPTDLAVLYPHPGQWPVGTVLLAGGFMLAMSGLAWALRKRAPFGVVGWLWFVGMLVPMIGLVQTGAQGMADRHTYLPSLGVLILAVWGVFELSRGWSYQMRVLTGMASVLVILCLALTRQQISYWKDSGALFRHALAVTENNWLAHNNLGGALDQKGHADEAIPHLQETIRLKPDYALAHYNLGVALGHQGRTDEAIRQYREALRLKPDDPDAHFSLGFTLSQKDQSDEAIAHLRETIRLAPDHHTDAYYLLGLALGQKGQIDEAIRQFQEVLRLKPDYPLAHYSMGNALLLKGQIDGAIRHFQETIRLEPDHDEAHYNLGVALATKGQTDEAIIQYQEAIRLKPGNADAHYNLGLALASKGQIEKAIGCFEAALRVKPGYPEAHHHLGLSLVRKGQTDEAIRQFREALRLKPDYAAARKNLDAMLATKARSPQPPGTSTNR